MLTRKIRLFAVLLAPLTVLAAPALAAAIPFFQPYPKLDAKRWYVSDGWANGSYISCEWKRSALSVKDKNLVLTFSDQGGEFRAFGCPEIHTNARSGYGVYEARLRSAAGSGLNTAFFTYVGPGTDSPAHDEVDFEFLGKNTRSVQVNYYLNGQAQDGTLVALEYDASKEFHNYSFAWTPTSITWYIDGKKIHETKPGAAMPSHSGRIYISLWSGSHEEDAWLGPLDYQGAATAEFSWVKYTPQP